MKQIRLEHSEEILAELCKRIGFNAELFDFTQKDWYLKHTWTQEQEEDFRIWLGKYLVTHKYARKGTYRGQNVGYYKSGKIIMNYGWKVK